MGGGIQMNEVTLECQGLPCPQPVLKSKKCIENETPHKIVVLVDNEPAQENVARFLASKGYTTSTEQRGPNRAVIGVTESNVGDIPTDDCPACQIMTEDQLSSATARTVAFITTDRLGQGDDELGSKLMLNFLATLPELGAALWRIVLVNGGVRLACQGNPCLEKIQQLSADGVSVLVCGTCLDHFQLLEQKMVGETTNMLDVVTSLQLASKVINV
jgi:selenium metabolism protein YedF